MIGEIGSRQEWVANAEMIERHLIAVGIVEHLPVGTERCFGDFRGREKIHPLIVESRIEGCHLDLVGLRRIETAIGGSNGIIIGGGGFESGDLERIGVIDFTLEIALDIVTLGEITMRFLGEYTEQISGGARDGIPSGSEPTGLDVSRVEGHHFIEDIFAPLESERDYSIDILDISDGGIKVLPGPCSHRRG